MGAEIMSEKNSRHEIGNTIVLDFFQSGKLINGVIAGIKYTDYGKVLYDIKLFPFVGEPQNEEMSTILKDVDSYFVKTEYDEFIGN